MGTSLDKIDDMIAYIESPEYLRMIASAQGESATALLGTDAVDPGPFTLPTSYSEPVRVRVSAPRPAFRGPNEAARDAARTIQLTTRDGWWKFGEALGSRAPFKTYGKFYGTDRINNLTGQLPAPYAEQYMSERPFIDYVVYSYWTPIAWHVWNPGITGVTAAESYWVYPQVRYSVTTSRHQTKIRTALVESGEDIRV